MVRDVQQGRHWMCSTAGGHRALGSRKFGLVRHRRMAEPVIQSGDRKSVDERNNTLSGRSMVDNVGVLVIVFRCTGCL